VRTYLSLERSHAEELLAAFQEDDVRYPGSLVEHFLQAYTHMIPAIVWCIQRDERP